MTVVNKWAMAYDMTSTSINHGAMVVNNRMFQNAARLEGAQLAEPPQLHRVNPSTDLETFVKQLDNEGYNLLVFVDDRKKKEDSCHEKLKQLESECTQLRIQHVLWKSIMGGKHASENIRRAVADSLKKMGQQSSTCEE